MSNFEIPFGPFIQQRDAGGVSTQATVELTRIGVEQSVRKDVLTAFATASAAGKPLATAIGFGSGYKPFLQGIIDDINNATDPASKGYARSFTNSRGTEFLVVAESKQVGDAFVADWLRQDASNAQ